MQKPVSATKFRNEVKRIDSSITCEVKNIRINGSLRGYSGFLIKGDRFVYVNHEVDTFVGNRDEGLYRKAKHSKDYTGGRNRFAKSEDMARMAVQLINGRDYDTDRPIANDTLWELRGW